MQVICMCKGKMQEYCNFLQITYRRLTQAVLPYVMKNSLTVAIVFAMLALAAAGCSSDEEIAARSCSRFTDDAANQQCQVNELARLNAEYEMIGAAMLSHPVRTSCTTIGGFTNCTSQ